MNWEMIIAIVTLLSAVLGYITILEKRRDKRLEKKEKEKEIEKLEFIEEVKEILTLDFDHCLKDKLDDYVTKREDLDMHKEILEGLKITNNAISLTNETIKSYQKEMHEAILSRIQGEIINFSESVKRGAKPSSIAYEHIYDAYRHYKSLGGNGFIDDMFSYIKKVRERQEEKDNDSKKNNENN